MNLRFRSEQLSMHVAIYSKGKLDEGWVSSFLKPVITRDTIIVF